MRNRIGSAAILWALAMLLAGCAASPPVHQVSTLQALMQGAYEGQIPCRDLPRYGTLGLGTFDALDGELILLDGQVYQATADGRIVRNPSTSVPFANVVRFRPKTVQRDMFGPIDMDALLARLDALASSKNLIYAVRIDAQFSQLKLRSVPRQSPPYPPLTEAVKQQTVFERKDVRGTLVGFRFPQYMSGVNMPGWHLHFISDDRRHGGHVLGLVSHQVDVQLQAIRRFEMALPDRGTFVGADLSKDMSKEIHQAEK